MLPYVIAVAAFVVALTLIVRFSGLVVRREIRAPRALSLTVAFVALLLVAWWFLTRGEHVEDRILSPIILPSPTEVIAAFPKLHFDQALVRNAGISFQRVTEGFVLAAIVAVPLGVYMATFPAVSAFFRPLALIGSYVPIIVFAPLTAAWFGIQEKQKITFLFIACFVVLLPLVIKAISDVPSAYIDVAVTKGATQWQLVRHVLFPVAKADIWEHLRGVYGVGWGWIILAEAYAGDSARGGLGYLISLSERRGHTAAIFAMIIVIVAIAVACDQLWRLGGRLLFPYRQRS